MEDNSRVTGVIIDNSSEEVRYKIPLIPVLLPKYKLSFWQRMKRWFRRH